MKRKRMHDDYDQEKRGEERRREEGREWGEGGVKG
jgi:hypothetical protein